MIDRRRFISTTVLSSVAALSGALAKPAFAHHADLTSSLVYLSPLSAQGRLSSCQAEVWFQATESGLYVVTAKDAWRAEAIDKGYDRVRLWVGDVGLWKRSAGKYLELPQLTFTAQRENDPVMHAQVLERMGRKYAAEWGTWGPRFQKGLTNGERVMLHYSPT